MPFDSLDERGLVDGHAQADEARVLVIDVPLSPEGLRGGAAFSGTALAALLRLMAARALEPVHRLLSRFAPHARLLAPAAEARVASVAGRSYSACSRKRRRK